MEFTEKDPAKKLLDSDWESLELLADDYVIDDSHGATNLGLRCKLDGMTINLTMSRPSLARLTKAGLVADNKITAAGHDALARRNEANDRKRRDWLTGMGARWVFHFEDEGQDVTWWAVSATGEIVHCLFQRSVWVGKQITNDLDNIEPGDQLMYFNDGDYFFKYPVVRIEDLITTDSQSI